MPLIASLSTTGGNANPQTKSEKQQDRYEYCLKIANQNNAKAIEFALEWSLDSEESIPSKHCYAAALKAIGRYKESALILEELAEATLITKKLKLTLSIQSAKSWFMASNYTRAKKILTKIIDEHPNDPRAYIERALIYATLKDFWAVIDDLNKTLDIDPAQTEALVLRGSAYRILGIEELSLDSLGKALDLKPKDVDALLELSLLLKDQNKIASAEAVWKNIIEISPSSNASNLAKKHLIQTQRNHTN